VRSCRLPDPKFSPSQDTLVPTQEGNYITTLSPLSHQFYVKAHVASQLNSMSVLTSHATAINSNHTGPPPGRRMDMGTNNAFLLPHGLQASSRDAAGATV
jgi:hypothetical protein